MEHRSVVIITTGGTIAKTFNEADGSLHNTRPVIETIVAGLRLPDLEVTFQHILSKDSRELTDPDRRLILEAVRRVADRSQGVIVAHGTDTLAETGEMLCSQLGEICVPVILTGAMRPYEFRDSDAAQNVTEALLALCFVSAGVYAAMHNRVLRFPGVVKDRRGLTFTTRRSS